MTFTKISYQVADDIATIAFNDPKTMNAAGIDTVEELSLALEQAADEARCTIITGEGRGFCSGANLSSNPGAPAPKGKPDAGKALDSHYNPFIKAMRTHPHPIITAVNGAAAGVGCSIALMGDFIISAESGYFLQAFRRIGLVPDGGATWHLARTIGRKRAFEIIATGEKLGAQKCLEWGLCNRVVPADELLDQSLEWARELAGKAPLSLRHAKQALNAAMESPVDAIISAEAKLQHVCITSDDAAEGAAAFLQKRAPVWQGR